MVDVLMNGKRMSVGKNLHDFLCQIGAFHGSGCPWLWIDAICIDQRNAEEKKLQVASMGRIYRSAGALILWLGQGDAATDHAFDLSADLQIAADNRHIFKQVCNVNSDLTTSILTALRSFQQVARSPYWTRLWIVQELVFRPSHPEEPSVLCGTRKASLSNLLDAMIQARRLTQDADAESGHFFKDLLSSDAWGELLGIEHSMHSLYTNLAVYPALEDNDLPSMLSNHSGRQCSEALDHVYALLSMCWERHLIQPNYKIQVSALFWQLAGFDPLDNDVRSLPLWKDIAYHMGIACALLEIWGEQLEFDQRVFQQAQATSTTTFALKTDPARLDRILSVVYGTTTTRSSVLLRLEALDWPSNVGKINATAGKKDCDFDIAFAQQHIKNGLAHAGDVLLRISPRSQLHDIWIILREDQTQANSFDLRYVLQIDQPYEGYPVEGLGDDLDWLHAQGHEQRLWLERHHPVDCSCPDPIDGEEWSGCETSVTLSKEVFLALIAWQTSSVPRRLSEIRVEKVIGDEEHDV